MLDAFDTKKINHAVLVATLIGALFGAGTTVLAVGSAYGKSTERFDRHEVEINAAAKSLDEMRARVIVLESALHAQTEILKDLRDEVKDLRGDVKAILKR